MFFDPNLLCRNGKFALIWLAATQGLKDVRKAEIEKVRIARTCDEILKFVMSKSTAPSQRLSLYLAAKLTWGIVVVYREQLKFLEYDAVYFSLSLSRRPYKFVEDDDGEVQPKPTRKKKSVKVRQEPPVVQLQDIEQQMLHAMPDASANVTDVNLITLRDEVSTRINLREQDLFGDEGQVDQQLAQLGDVSAPEPHPIPPVDAEAAALDKRQITVEDVEQSPSKRRRLEGAPLSPVVRVQQFGSISPDSPRRAVRPPAAPVTPTTVMPPPAAPVTPTTVMPPPAAPVTPATVMPPPASPRVLRSRIQLSDAEIRENLQQPPSTPPRRVQPPRRRLDMEYSVLTPRRWQHEPIYHDKDMYAAALRSPSRNGSQISLSPRRLDPKEIIAEILAAVPYTDEDIISVVRDLNDNLSLNCDISRLRMASERHAQTLDPVRGAKLTVIDHELTTVPGLTEQRFMETMPPEQRLLETMLPEQQLLETMPPIEMIPEVPLLTSSRFSRIPMEQDPGRITEETDQEQHIPRIHTSTPVTLDTEAKRIDALLQYIRGRFVENGNQPLTLEELCYPLNRLRVARTFNGLLLLHSQQYVKLKSEVNSLALRSICPGRNI